jgi:uncharacterized coiled-coil protein SlyX
MSTEIDSSWENARLQDELTSLRAKCIKQDEELSLLRAKVQELERQNDDHEAAIGQLIEEQEQSYISLALEGIRPNSVSAGIDALVKQLAASQLEVARLREALQTIFGNTMDPDDENTAQKALATPTSTEALDAYVAEKVKEALARADLTVGIPMDAANDLPMIQCIESTVDAALGPIGYTRTDTDKADGYAALRYRRFGIALKPAKEGE